MALFGRKKKEETAAAPKDVQSDVTSPSHSGAPSITDLEKTEAEQSQKATDGKESSTQLPETEMNAAEKRIDGIQKDAEENDEVDYPKSMKLVLITIALCLSVFCMALDNTIISTAIPRITDQFHAIDDVGWYGSAYLLTTCAFQLMFGKLYTFYSIKWIYLTCLGIFEIGSAICGAAPNSTAFIIGRAIAGLGAAGIFSGAILIVANTVPLRKRPIYTGLIGGMYGIASVAGPLMGGAFTDHVTLLFIFIFYHPTQRAQTLKVGWKAKLEQFDIVGTLVFLPMVVCLLLALQWGGSRYDWGDGRIIALLVVFCVLLISFISIQFWKKDNATVPPRVIKKRSIAAGAWFGASLGAAFFVFVYYLPIWFQAIKGVSAMKSGIMNIPMILSLVVASLIGGVAVTVLGYYTPFAIAASVLMSIGAGLLSTFETDTGSSKWIGYQIIFGFGVGFGMQQTLIAAQTVLPKADIPIGTAIMMFSQTLGGAIFISVAQNVFTNRLLHNLREVLPTLNPEMVLSAGATLIKDVVPEQYLAGVQTAYNDAIASTFYVAVALAALSIFGSASLEWKSVKGKKVEMAAA